MYPTGFLKFICQPNFKNRMKSNIAPTGFVTLNCQDECTKHFNARISDGAFDDFEIENQGMSGVLWQGPEAFRWAVTFFVYKSVTTVEG